MSYVNRIIALVSGIALFPVCGYVSGFVNNVLIPTNYSEYFGNGYLAVVLIPHITVPCFILSLAWSWITLRWLARPPRVAVRWLLGGLLLGFVSCSWYLIQHDEYLFGLRDFSEPLVAFFVVLFGLAAVAAIESRFERIAVQERVIFDGREAILVAVVAFVCGALGGSIWASSAKSEEITVDAHNDGGDEWTSTHMKVKGGELIEVYANGELAVNRGDDPYVQRVYPNGTRDGLGRLDMRFENRTVGPAPNLGYGQWVGHVYEPETIQFRIRGDKNQMSGQYHVSVTVIPPFMARY
jgi:hypothetical protein